MPAAPSTTPTRRSERLRAFRRQYDPTQSPNFRLWPHGLDAVFLLGLALAAFVAPGLIADVSGIQIGPDATSWQYMVMARIWVGVVMLWALLAVRAMHPLMYAAISVAVVGLIVRLAVTRVNHDPLTLGQGLLLLSFLLITIRVCTRPNDTDRILALELELQDARAELEQLRSRP